MRRSSELNEAERWGSALQALGAYARLTTHHIVGTFISRKAT